MDARRVVFSEMEFLSYRIVDMKVSSQQSLYMLFFSEKNHDDAKWTIRVGFNNIYKYQEKYIVSLTTEMLLLKIANFPEVQIENAYMSVGATISGIFKFSQTNQEDNELRNTLLYRQAPAILFPFLRSTIGTLLTNAGFGSVIVPLLNIYEMTKEKLPLQIISIEDLPSERNNM